MSLLPRSLAAWAFVPVCLAQPEYTPLNRAYEPLRAKDYDTAIRGFQEAIQLAPTRADIRKDLAYTQLKVGENEAAREQFAKAMEINPADRQVALEFAYLSFESKDDPIPSKAAARRIFDKLRRTGDATAEQAFQNIDKPLEQGIARWTQALTIGPDSFSAHYELAQLAEQRDESVLAEDHYLKAWNIQPARKEVLLDLARVRKAQGHPEDATAALLAASRGGEPRAAERARELLPERYPYVYEFRKALELDPHNATLKRELAYLLLAMGDKIAAEKEFEAITTAEPEDLLSAAQLGLLYLAKNDRDRAMPLFQRVLNGHDYDLSKRIRNAIQPNVMAERSLKAGYLKEALRYLKIAHESDPDDCQVILQLGWTYNMLHDDRTAIEWFKLARQSDDPKIASEASRAYEALRPEVARFRTTAWVLPFYSSRWNEFFGYGQIKTELRMNGWRVRPYVSTRLVANAGPSSAPQPLSEQSFIIGVGVVSQWRRFTGWAEAGSAVSYVRGSMTPDYRGGVSWARGWINKRKLFVELNADEVFISRFGNDWLSYLQSRTGYRWFLMNANLTADSNRQYWANFAEAGPGVRFHVPDTPKAMVFSVSYLRGMYLVRQGNPRGTYFSDLRAGFWYAITR